MNLWTPRNTLILGAVLVAGVWYAKKQGLETLSALGAAVNPTDQNNLANRGFNAVYQGVTGSDGTLGTDMAARVERGRENPPETTAGLPNDGFDFSKLKFWGDG